MALSGVIVGTGVTITPGVSIVSTYNGVIMLGTAGGPVAYQWNSDIGFGTKYADPGSTVGDGEIAFTTAADAVAQGAISSPYVIAYPWSNSTGFGTKYANPGTNPASRVLDLDFSPTDDALACGISLAPYSAAYKWSSATGFGTKYANPGTQVQSTGSGVAFSPDGAAVAFASGGTPYIQAYSWTYASGFGTKYANPATLPTGPGSGIAFSPSGDAVIITNSGSSGSPFAVAYPWDSSTGFGTKYAALSSPTISGGRVAFSPAGDAFAIAGSASTGNPKVAAYAWNSATGFGAKYANPATMSTGNYNANSVRFSPDGKAIAVGTDGSNSVPYIYVWAWNSATGFGTQYANPATAVTSVVNGIAFSSLTV